MNWYPVVAGPLCFLSFVLGVYLGRKMEAKAAQKREQSLNSPAEKVGTSL